MLWLPVGPEIPALEAGQEQRDRVLAGAHVADRACLLAIPRQAGGGQRIEWHPLVATGQQRLAHAGPPEHALDRADVEVLATVRAGHDGELGGLQIELLEAASLDQRYDTERLDGRAQGHDPVWVAELADEPATDVRFDDVPAVDALLDAVAQLADEDRRLGTGASLRTRPAVPGLRALGGGGHSGEDTAQGSRGRARVVRVSDGPSGPARHRARDWYCAACRGAPARLVPLEPSIASSIPPPRRPPVAPPRRDAGRRPDPRGLWPRSLQLHVLGEADDGTGGVPDDCRGRSDRQTESGAQGV